MSYTPTTWKTGDVISSAKLNKLEQGVADKQDQLTFDNAPTEGSNNPVTSGGVQAALATKQDTLTFDSVPTEESTNPVTSGGVYTALEAKANIEDVTKEISKETARSYMTESISGSIVKFSDGADDIPMEEVRVNFSPIQNLNGYDYPWIGGAGKNKLPIDFDAGYVLTHNGVTFTVLAEGTIKVNGTATANAEFGFCRRANNHTVAAGSYAISGVAGSTTETFRMYFAGGGLSTAVTQYDAERTITLTDDTAPIYAGITVFEGNTVSNVIVKPMLRLTSSSSGFAPYENLCPITGRTGVNVERTNKNLWNPDDVMNSYFYIEGNLQEIRSMSGGRVIFIPCKPNTTYTISKTAGQRFRVAYATETPANNLAIYSIVTNHMGSSITYTTGSDAKYLVAFVYLSSADTTITAEEMLASVQIELGSSATDYVAPSSQHHAITWEDKGTIYGGYVDAVKGKLVATQKMIDMGSVTYSYGDNAGRWNHFMFYANVNANVNANAIPHFISSAYKSDETTLVRQATSDDCIYASTTTGYVYIRDDSYTDADAFQTSVTGQQLVFDLPTPIEYDIDAVEIKSLYGDNVMWSDGDTIEVSYHADTETLMDSKIEEAKSQTVSVSGTAPTITAAENTRYVCGEVVSLSFTPCASGVCEVIFTAGSTVPVITLPSTVKMPEWYEIEANHVYEISVLNGVYGAVMSWAV